MVAVIDSFCKVIYHLKDLSLYTRTLKSLQKCQVYS